MNRLHEAGIITGVGAAAAAVAIWLVPIRDGQADAAYNAQVNACAAQMGYVPAILDGALDPACNQFQSEYVPELPLSRAPHDAIIYKQEQTTPTMSAPMATPPMEYSLPSAEVFQSFYYISAADEDARTVNRYGEAGFIGAIAGGCALVACEVALQLPESKKQKKAAPKQSTRRDKQVPSYVPRPIESWEWKQSFRRMEKALSQIPDITYNSTNTQ